MTMDLKPRIHFITLGVKDVSIATAFYIRLGFKASAMSNENVSFFDANGIVLSVFGHDALAHDATAPAEPAPAFRGVSVAWNGETEAHVDAIFAHALAAGATAVKTPQKVFWGGYSGYFADPDGHLWEVAFNPFAALNDAKQVVLP
jgi:uncharacterized protein